VAKLRGARQPETPIVPQFLSYLTIGVIERIESRISSAVFSAHRASPQAGPNELECQYHKNCHQLLCLAETQRLAPEESYLFSRAIVSEVVVVRQVLNTSKATKANKQSLKEYQEACLCSLRSSKRASRVRLGVNVDQPETPARALDCLQRAASPGISRRGTAARIRVAVPFRLGVFSDRAGSSTPRTAPFERLNTATVPVEPLRLVLPGCRRTW
jgi:hypothetical protein